MTLLLKQSEKFLQCQCDILRNNELTNYTLIYSSE